MMDKMKPRPGAARGQGEGMGGYNASKVGKAMAGVKGGGGKPSYFGGVHSAKKMKY